MTQLVKVYTSLEIILTLYKFQVLSIAKRASSGPPRTHMQHHHILLLHLFQMCKSLIDALVYKIKETCVSLDEILVKADSHR